MNRPDHIKYELAALTDCGIGSDLRKQLETRLSRGLLEFIPEIKHWGMEEFFWHGLPGNPWHAIDHFLRRQGERFPEACASAIDAPEGSANRLLRNRGGCR